MSDHLFSLVSTEPRSVVVYCSCGWIGDRWHSDAGKARMIAQWKDHLKAAGETP